MRRFLPLAFFGFACAGSPDACPSFDEIRVTNPDGGASPEAMDEVRATVARFASWNGGDGACVDEIRLIDGSGAREPVAGLEGPRITLDHTSPGLWLDTQYHLCMAIDRRLGWVSERRPDWFPSEYPREELARACQTGPRNLGLLQGLDAACGVDVGGGRQAFLNDVFFGAAEVPHHEPVGTLPLSLERRVVAGLPEGSGWAIASAGSTLVAPVADRGIDGVDPGGIAYVDPDLGEVVAITGAPEVGPHDRPHVLASLDEPVVVYIGEETHAYRIEADGAWAPLPFPHIDFPISNGVVTGDIAWLLARPRPDGPQALLRIDLQTGVAVRRSLPEKLSSAYSVRPLPDGNLAFVGWSPESRRLQARYEPRTDHWAVQPSPLPWVVDHVPLADGRILAWWYESHTIGHGTSGLAVIDPATGDWWLSDQPCTDDQTGSSALLLELQGEAWLWEHPTSWFPGAPFDRVGAHVLTRIDVPAP